MPRAKRICGSCNSLFQPHTNEIADRGVCAPCWKNKDDRRGSVLQPINRCGTCTKPFVVPKTDPGRRYCVSCLRPKADKANPYKTSDGSLPVDTPGLLAPMKQIVFDLETWGLDRGWGVVLVGSMLIHDGAKSRMKTFTLRDYRSWPKIRSNDSELGADILKELYEADILFAHNGARFDVPFLNSVALKYGMPRLNAKLVDPVQIFRNKYRIGSNSLGSIAQFLKLEEQKMPVEIDTWRRALLDNDDESWKILVERCESDVRVLNAVASAVIKDVAKIDGRGSAGVF